MGKYNRKNRYNIYKKRKYKYYNKIRNNYKYNIGNGNYRNNQKADKTQPSLYTLINNFSIIDNTEEYNKTINGLHSYFKIHKNIRILANNITNITPESMTVFVSKLMKKDSVIHHIISGTDPDDSNCKKIWLESGFTKYVNHKYPSKYTKGLISYMNYADIKPRAINELIKFATSKLLGYEASYNPVQSIFVELMGNSNEHAHKSKQGGELWWASVYYDEISKIAKFCFLDNGVGIFKTLKGISLKNTIYSKVYPNTTIFQKLLNGELELSKTKKVNRGNGLRGIYKRYKRGEIKNLIFISNNVYANLDNDKFVELKNEFYGTFIYWEITDEYFKN